MWKLVEIWWKYGAKSAKAGKACLTCAPLFLVSFPMKKRGQLEVRLISNLCDYGQTQIDTFGGKI